MPAVSKAQQSVFGMAYAVKKGKMKLSEIRSGIRQRIARMSSEMSEDQLKDYASTKREGLPRHVGQRSTRHRNVKS